MKKKYKSRKKRISRRDLKEAVKRERDRAERAEYRATSAEENAEKINKRIRDIGIKCVDSLHGGPLEHKVITPIQYGCYSVICDDTPMFGTEELIKMAKDDLARRIADCLIDQNLVQFIIHRAGEYTPLDYGQTTVGAKMYIVPWEKMSVWKDSITIGNIRRYQNGW